MKSGAPEYGERRFTDVRGDSPWEMKDRKRARRMARCHVLKRLLMVGGERRIKVEDSEEANVARKLFIYPDRTNPIDRKDEMIQEVMLPQRR